MIFDFLERWRKARLEKEMLEFRERSLASFPKVTGEPKFPTVQIEHTFLRAGGFNDEETQPTPETPVDDILGPPAPHVSSVQYIDNQGAGPDATVGTIGGEKIQVNGDNFRKGEQGQVPTIKIGDVAATEVVWKDDLTLECRSPQHETGAYPVVVTLSNDQKSNEDVKLNYLPRPGVNSISPNSGPVGTKVLISGFNFGNAGNSNAFLAHLKMFEANTSPNEFNQTTIPGAVKGTGYDISVVNSYSMQGFLRKGFSVTDVPPPPPPPPPPGGGLPAILELGPNSALSNGNPLYFPQIWNGGASVRIEARTGSSSDGGTTRVDWTGTVSLSYQTGPGLAGSGPTSVSVVNGISANFTLSATLGITVNRADLIVHGSSPTSPSIPFGDSTKRYLSPNPIYISVTR